MMKRLIFLVLPVAVCLTSVANAGYDIILISDANPPDVADGAHEDDALVAWLEGLGYTVDTSGMGGTYQDDENPFADPAKVAALNSAGMVVVTRRANSGDHDENRKNWNELGNPLLLMSGYITRGEGADKRWGWTTGASENTSPTETDVEVMGLVIETWFDWSDAPTPGEVPSGRNVYLPKIDGSSEFDSSALVIATFDDHPMMVLMDEGTDLDALNGTADKYGILGADRGFLAHWGYDNDLNYGEGDPRNRRANWGDFITDGYKDALSTMVAELIPEPATIALLGLGGLALISTRKRR
jgi:hypothetical protein